MAPERRPSQPSARRKVRVLIVRQCERCDADPQVNLWTGQEIRLLREALRMSVRDWAIYLGVTARMVPKWEQGGRRIRPRPFNQTVLDAALRLANAEVRRRFALSLHVSNSRHEGNDLNPRQRKAVRSEFEVAQAVRGRYRHSDSLR